MSLSTAFKRVAAVPPTVEKLMAALHAQDAQRAKEIEAMRTQLPEGFALVPVLYTRIPGNKRGSVEREYTEKVYPAFLRFLAATQVQALKRLGVCDTGISRMARGLAPARADGHRYDLSVDHIIERGGSGVMAMERRADVLNDGQETYPVNHFRNLILLPEDVHAFKNRLNGLQRISEISAGESQWILMMVPVRDAVQNGYVSAPQTGRKLTTRAPKTFQHIGEVSHLVDEVRKITSALQMNFAVGYALHQTEKKSGALRAANSNLGRACPDDTLLCRRDSVADLSGLRGNSLQAEFNSHVARDAASVRILRDELRPAVQALATGLANLNARLHPGNKALAEFFYGRQLQGLCETLARYPVPESRHLLEICRGIDAGMRANGAKPPEKKQKFG